ncbi:hypothetical protein AB4144_09190, partial [Rhizobiaceae sp. 2RAB30]
VLNRDWPRQSDDIDIFHDTDEEIGFVADADIALLRQAGFRVSIDVQIYGCVEATVSRGLDATLVQWMSETRTRFFPLVRDDEWGARLHQADLAINKIVAASTRTKARDFVDIVAIAEMMCPVGPLVLAAAGKPPHFSPQKFIDEMRRRGLSISDEHYDTVKGIPSDWNARYLRDRLAAVLDQAEGYLMEVPVDLVGLLAVTPGGVPIEVTALDDGRASFRKATAELEIVPLFPDASSPWQAG